MDKLSEIINLSKIYGFSLKIYTPPFYHKQCVNHSKFLSDFLKNNEISYQNYSDLFINNDDLKLWKDDIHLSLLGAEHFTKFLKSNL